MTDESFSHVNRFEGNEIHNVIQVGSVGSFEVRMPPPPDPREVPPPPRSWVNRDAELDELERDLASGDPEEVVLAGPEGVGKTAMAQMLTARLEQRFPDGHLYIDLADGDVKTKLRSALIRLGVPKEFLTDDSAGLRGQYVSKTRDKALLVVVDDAPSREAALMFKPGSHASGFLVLGYRWPEHPGSLVHTLRDLAAEHAAEYLRSVCPDLTADEIDENIEGRPWRPAHLERLVGMIRTIRREAARPARPASTAEAMLEATYLSLSEPAAWLYRFLSALPGREFEPDMLRAVGLGQTEALDELMDANLVGSTGGSYRVQARRPVRAGPTDDLVPSLSRVVHYYLRKAQLADPKIQGEKRLRRAAPIDYIDVADFPDRDAALRWMDDHRNELVEAVRLAQLFGLRREQWALAEAMWPLFSNRPYPELAERCYESALDGLQEPQAKARMLICLGRVQVDLREYAESESNLADAVRFAGDDVDLVASAKEQLGWLYYKQGRMDEAEATYLEGKELAERERTKALMTKLLGFVYRDRGRDRDARVVFSEARRRFQEVGDKRNITITEFELAALNVKLDPERHLADADEAIKRLGEGGWTKPLVDALKWLGAILSGAEGQARIDAAKKIERGFGIES